MVEDEDQNPKYDDLTYKHLGATLLKQIFVCVFFVGKRVYSSEHTFCQHQGNGLPAIHIMLQIGSSMDTKIWYVSRL